MRQGVQMMDLSLIDRRPLKVLCLGAHSDDIEIGCAGTLLKLAGKPGGVHVDWVVLGAGAKERASEARASASGLLKGIRSRRIIVKGFRDGHFPFQGSAIKEYLEGLKKTEPDVIFTHCREDLHQDHRLIAELSWQTFRDHLILEYEVPKYDGDLGSPNVFVDLDEPAIRSKVEHILHHFPSQNGRAWFTDETFRALARLRGVESRAPGSYAEAFYCRKLLCRL
jgi:LmbE family N-acetylglucosaminyl deacetylase